MRTPLKLLTIMHAAEAITRTLHNNPVTGATPDQLYQPLAEYLSASEFEKLMRTLVEGARVTYIDEDDRYYPYSSQKDYP